MAQITRISPIVAGGASGSTPTIAQLITHDLISRGQINLLTAADGQRITGQILGDMIGSAFDAHRGFATMTAVAASATAMTAVAASATAMTAVAASVTATEAIRLSAIANNTALGSSFSVGAYIDRIRIIGGAATDATLAAQATMTAVAASATAMTAVAASATAMTAVAASGIALRAICMHQPASSAATSALQSRRATIIPTMNAATAQFTRQANLSMDICSGGGPVSVGSGTHSIAIPLSWGPATQGPETVYTITSLANSAAIFSGAGNSGLLALSGVALRGLQASRNYTGGSAPTITYDMYTAIL